MPTLFIQYNERERYQRLPLYKGIQMWKVDFKEGGETEYPENNVRGQIGINNLNLAHMRPRGQDWTWVAKVGSTFDSHHVSPVDSTWKSHLDFHRLSIRPHSNKIWKIDYVFIFLLGSEASR